jgi:outer membrane lipoprotein carrier protein
MKPRLSRVLSTALVLVFAIPACNESPAPGASGASATASVKAEPAVTATAAPTTTAVASAEPTATAEPAPTAVATATATATAKASSAPTAKATAKAQSTAKPSSSPSSAPTTTAAANAPTAAPTTTAAAEIPPPAEGSADAIAQKVDVIFSPKKNYFAKFKQKLEQKVTGQKKESTGALNVERPNKVSFRYDPPNKNRVVADGTTLKAYVAEDNQMFESKVSSSAYAGGLAFFMGGLLKTMSFTFNEKADYKDGYVLIGKPRSPSPSYEFVIFYVNKALLEKGDPGCLERIVIVDAQGNKNRFDFTEASFPASVPATEWEFTAPPGTNITKN